MAITAPVSGCGNNTLAQTPTEVQIDWPRIATASALNVMKNGGSDRLAELASTTVLVVCNVKSDKSPTELLDEAASTASNKALREEMNATSAGLVGVAILRAGQTLLPGTKPDEIDDSMEKKNATYLFLSCCSLKYV
mmetsp:Transcript_18559/g.23042  ORF Transcript_18559/g.23042 Transcript_18559/m.23042 type:complete len:137 (+) Transcript_18559:3-413(+)